MTHPDDEYHRVIGRCEQVAIQGYLIHQVLERDQLSSGSFVVDVAKQKLMLWDAGGRDPNKLLVEASVRQEIMRVEGEYVQLQGLHFRCAANAAQHGAVVLTGRHDQMTDCVVEAMNSCGATFQAEDLIIRRCTFRDNGQIGFGASGAHNLLFTGCRVENNNTKGFDRGWEAGGNKIVLTRGAVLDQSQFLRNRGNGVWFDIGNEHCTVSRCLIADNEDSGIFYEISLGLQAHDNVILGNGFAATPGAWGAQAGISLSSSPDCVIERNLIYGNREGFNFREQTRTTPTIHDRQEHAVWNHDDTICHNLIACNRDAQIWGWFDMHDSRHWPAEQGRGGVGSTQTAGASVATDSKGQPIGLTLQQLRLRFQDNFYFAEPDQRLFEWGVTWGRHQSYPTLRDFQTALGVDEDGQILEPRFANALGLDFRLDSEQMSQFKNSYPIGEVPDVLLGQFRE
jgi:parallel beta-helix repeat protein